jgi:hypothetical protein
MPLSDRAISEMMRTRRGALLLATALDDDAKSDACVVLRRRLGLMERLITGEAPVVPELVGCCAGIGAESSAHSDEEKQRRPTR